ncbi:hypothetical protein FKM82_019051 [Ascaphus truei]
MSLKVLMSIQFLTSLPGSVYSSLPFLAHSIIVLHAEKTQPGLHVNVTIGVCGSHANFGLHTAPLCQINVAVTGVKASPVSPAT